MKIYYYWILERCIISLSIIIPLLMVIAFFTLLERKVMASLQRRVGPNIHGYYGVFQPFLDGVKLLTKELLIPAKANFYIFLFSPLFMMTLSFSLWAIIPLSYNISMFDSNFSLLFFFILSSLNVYNIILAGWSSNSKYAFLGSVRAIAQFLSYELIFGFALLFMLLFIGSLRIFAIIYKQYYIGFLLYPLLPFALIFFIVLLMETNRAPFDLPEAESELVAGYNVEYSSIMFAMFFLGEYCNIISMSSIWIILFWGGFAAHSYGSGLFIVKILFFCFLFIFIRSLLPRYRLDQLIYVGWHVMLPVCIGILFFLTSLLALTQGAALTLIHVFYRPILSWLGFTRCNLYAQPFQRAHDHIGVWNRSEYAFSIFQWISRMGHYLNAYYVLNLPDELVREHGCRPEELDETSTWRYFLRLPEEKRDTAHLANGWYGSACDIRRPGVIGILKNTAVFENDDQKLLTIELSFLRSFAEESLLIAWSPWYKSYMTIDLDLREALYNYPGKGKGRKSPIDTVLMYSVGFNQEELKKVDKDKKTFDFIPKDPVNTVSLLQALDWQLTDRVDFSEYSRAMAWKLRYKHPLHLVYDLYWKSGGVEFFDKYNDHIYIGHTSSIPDTWAFIESKQMRRHPKEIIKEYSLEEFSVFPIYKNVASKGFKCWY